MCADILVDQGRVGHVFCCGDGYSYHRNRVRFREDGNFSLYLRCCRYRYLHCAGTACISVFGDQVQWVNHEPHSCPQDHGGHDGRTLRYELLRACRRYPYENPRRLLNRLASRYPVDVASRVRLAQVRFAMRRARLGQYPNIPPTLPLLGQLLGSDNYLHLTSTLDGEDRIYSATVGTPGDMCVIFVSARMLRFLSSVKRIFVDATFLPTPARPLARQVYQIVTVVRNTVVPIVQVIMESKSCEAYRSILRYLKDNVPNFRPRSVMMDFEASQYLAWSQEYGCEIVCCYVHFVRAVMKKGGKLGVKRLMRNDVNAEVIVRCLLAIPLLPRGLLQRGFFDILQYAIQLGVYDDLVEFFSYFLRTWLSGWHYENLSVYQQEHRTNNACESANRVLRLETGPHHPSIWTFIGGIRNYEQSAYTDVVAFRMGRPLGSRRRTSVLLNDIAIQNFTSDLENGSISIRRFLKCTSRRITQLLAYLM